jgi:hypothetical protein
MINLTNAFRVVGGRSQELVRARRCRRWRDAATAHIFNCMADRPCKPDADLKGLWRMLLGTPFPACGMAEESEAAGGDRAASGSSEIHSAAQDAKGSAKGK